jgi:hypothetical protein
MSLIVAGLSLAGSALIVRGLDRMCRRARLIELSRYPGHEQDKKNYEARLKAAGLAPIRNVRNAPVLLLTHERGRA